MEKKLQVSGQERQRRWQLKSRCVGLALVRRNVWLLPLQRGENENQERRIKCQGNAMDVVNRELQWSVQAMARCDSV